MFMVEKKSLTEYSYSVKDGKSKSFPRCHLDSRVHSHALCKILTYLRQLTYALRRKLLGSSFSLRPQRSI